MAERDRQIVHPKGLSSDALRKMSVHAGIRDYIGELIDEIDTSGLPPIHRQVMRMVLSLARDEKIIEELGITSRQLLRVKNEGYIGLHISKDNRRAITEQLRRDRLQTEKASADERS